MLRWLAFQSTLVILLGIIAPPLAAKDEDGCRWLEDKWYEKSASPTLNQKEYTEAVEACVDNTGGKNRPWGYFMDLNVKRYPDYKRQLITSCWDELTKQYPKLVIEPVSIVVYIVNTLTGTHCQNGGGTADDFIQYDNNLAGAMANVAAGILPNDFDKPGTKYNFFNQDAHTKAAQECVGEPLTTSTNDDTAKTKKPSETFCDLYPENEPDAKRELIACVWRKLMTANSQQFIYPRAVVRALVKQLDCKFVAKPVEQSMLASFWSAPPTPTTQYQQIRALANAIIPDDQFYYYFGMPSQ